MTKMNLNSIFVISGVLASLKFGNSEKHTKFEKNLSHGFDNSVDLLSKCQNHEEDFSKLCVLLKKSELYEKFLSNSVDI